MITRLDKNKILILRSQNHSYQKIHEKLGFAIETIMKICTEEKKQKNIKKETSQRERSNSNDSIDKLRNIDLAYDDFFKTGKLNASERRKWEIQKKDIREILKIDVDDRIANERIQIIKKIDEKWSREIENNYVNKTIAANFENTIKEKDNIIEKLKSKIEIWGGKLIEKENELSHLKYSKNCEIKKLNNQLIEINDKNYFLSKEIKILWEYIDNQLDLDVKIKQDRLNDEIYVLNIEKRDFLRNKEKKQFGQEKLDLELQVRLKNLEKREKKLEKQNEEIKQQKSEIFKERENLIEDMRKHISKRNEENDHILNQLKMIKKKDEQLKIEDQRLREIKKPLEKNGFLNISSLPCPKCTKPMLIDPSNPEIYNKLKSCFGNYTHADCILKNEQPKRVTLQPVSYSGEPILQSGFSPIIPSGGEPMVGNVGGGI